VYNKDRHEKVCKTNLKKEVRQMTTQELLTTLTRLPHDAIIQVDNNGVIIEPVNIVVEMSTDLYEQRDHIILKCN
jgi:hypothetical protein